MGRNDETESFYRDTDEDMSSENNLEDPLTFWHDEKKTLWKKISGRSEFPFLVMGVVLILFILVFFLVVPKGGDGELSRQVAELSDRLQRVEEKLTNMEAPLGGAAQLGSRVDKVEKSLLSFDASNASVASKMNRMADELDQIQKDVSALNSQKNSVKKIPAASSTSGKTQPASQPVYHEVQPGETLYGISRQYNLSVDALRRLNGLSDQASIYPGQKLKVKASGN